MNRSNFKYERPWTIDEIREHYGDEVGDRLAADPECSGAFEGV